MTRRLAVRSHSPQVGRGVGSETLAADLRSVTRGEVRFDDGSRAAYSTDGSNYRQLPVGVVIPADAEDVCAAVDVCRAHEVPVLGRGGGTSLAGQCCNVAVVIDFSKYMNRVKSIDETRSVARVEPGVVLDQLQLAAESHGLMFGPDPATHVACTIGGMIGNNSCGIRSVMAGRTADNVEELGVLLYDGTRMKVGPTTNGRGEIFGRLRALGEAYGDEIRSRFPKIPRRVSGYNLDELLPERGLNVARALVGTEGTCALVLEATVRLVPRPNARSLLVLGYPDVFTAADHAPEILSSRPMGLEGIDDLLISYEQRKHMNERSLRMLPEGDGWLLVEFGADSKKEADERANEIMSALRKHRDSPSMKLFDDPDEEKHIWEVRESALGATARIPGHPDTWEGWEDSAVPPDRLGDYLRGLRVLYDRYEYDASLYGHFGDGCVHTRIDFDLVTAEGIARFRAFLDDAAELCLGMGGSLSGEHGDGQSRAELLPRMFGPDIVRAFEEFKEIWDPQDKMNPGMVVHPYRITENLRLGTDYRPWEPATEFAYTDDDGSFARASARCVGVGKCRRSEGGTMCPSYMVTREEIHSTRGRARLLFEMLQGELVTDGWRSREVAEALDLCLACKGCLSDCPVNVDMATYKAEFLYHHYRGHLRPAAHYSMGLLPYFARAVSRTPRLANALTHTPFISAMAKRAAGLDRRREIPRFARQDFRTWFAVQRWRSEGRRVLLWPDTFDNYLQPGVAAACAGVLSELGFTVDIPAQSLCCGLPMITNGLLPAAKRSLRRVLDSLSEDISSQTPIVVMEPSCASVFRHDLTELFPHDEDAKRLSQQVHTLSEFIERFASDKELPALRRSAVVHGHCHQKAVMGTEADRAVLKRLGVSYEMLDSGCCGLAGSFGFERGHYDVSMACGERVLLPAVRSAAADTMIITDGFSCRSQIEHATSRRALHLAQVIDLAMNPQRLGPGVPEQACPVTLDSDSNSRLTIGAGAAGVALAGWLWHRHRRNGSPCVPSGKVTE